MAEFLPVSSSTRVYKIKRYPDSEDFHQLYRFNENSVILLTEHFLGESLETRGGALTNEEKMRIFLRFVGDPGFQSGIAEDIGVHQSTVSRVINEVSSKIASRAKDWIVFPQTPEEIQEEKAIWSKKYKFPDAIGAIDCTHIRIKKPSLHSDEYINRKGYYSINVQATCNAQDLFTSVDISWPGSVHDSRILKNSFLYKKMNESDGILLGDEGYGITRWLMTPFRTASTDAERKFNTLLSKERVIVERCFGQLKQRFPLLQYKIRVKEKTVPNVIASCFILHNFAKYLKEDNFDSPNRRMAGEYETIEDEIMWTDTRVRNAGQQRRREIAAILAIS